MSVYMYVCSNCGRPHSSGEFEESRFCQHCGKFLTSHDKRVLEETGKKKKQVFKLEKNVETNIEKTYELILQKTQHDIQVDSIGAVKQVEEYRQFWKPKKTNVVLLAESHVYTNEQDFKMKCDRSVVHNLIPNYPTRFVRFVYCLGYGEDELLTGTRADRKNTGTPQYWKIFSSCVAENENDLSFDKALKTGTPSFSLRLQNKTEILKKMKKKGVWLLDASIVGLYGSGTKDLTTMETIIGTCWRSLTADIISEASPKHIIVIGKGVGNILSSKIRRLGFTFTVIPQPQARGSSEWQLENFRKYQRICGEYP